MNRYKKIFKEEMYDNLIVFLLPEGTGIDAKKLKSIEEIIKEKYNPDKALESKEDYVYSVTYWKKQKSSFDRYKNLLIWDGKDFIPIEFFEKEGKYFSVEYNLGREKTHKALTQIQQLMLMRKF